jgi:hypothetical protein
MKVERIVPPPVEETYNITGMSRENFQYILDALFERANVNRTLGNLGIADKQLKLHGLLCSAKRY